MIKEISSMKKAPKNPFIPKIYLELVLK